jgi:Family of unknown function (DUF6228)
MGESFAIASVHGGRQLQFLGNIPRGLTGYDGCTFTAKLVGPDVGAAVEVYEIQPQQWSELFRGLAKDWRGWSGERTKESLEGHIRLACTADRTGHVTIRVRLRSMVIGDDWRVEADLRIEAGQLDRLANAATDYFG